MIQVMTAVFVGRVFVGLVKHEAPLNLPFAGWKNSKHIP